MDDASRYTIKEILAALEGRLERQLAQLAAEVRRLADRVGELEQSRTAEREVESYRRWLLGAAVAVIALGATVVGLLV